MQLERKVLAFGRLPSSKGDLYVPAGVKGYVQNAVFHNTGGSVETVRLNYHDGISEHQWLQQSIAAGDTLTLNLPGEGDTVDAGGRLTGSTDTADTVVFKLSGTEEGWPGHLASNLWTPPVNPSADDDEFSSGFLGSEWSAYIGWASSLASFSVGTVDAYDSGFTSGTVVRVDPGVSKPSWLLLQQPVSGTTFFQVAKPYTFPTNVLIVARMKFNAKLNVSNNDDSTIGLTLWEDNGGGAIDQIESIELLLNESDVGTVQAKMWRRVSGSVVNIVTSTDVDSDGQALEYVALHKIGTTYHGWVGTASGNWIWMESFTDARTFGHVGFFMSMASNSSPAPHILGVDFIRFIETDNFLL